MAINVCLGHAVVFPRSQAEKATTGIPPLGNGQMKPRRPASNLLNSRAAAKVKVVAGFPFTNCACSFIHGSSSSSSSSGVDGPVKQTPCWMYFPVAGVRGSSRGDRLLQGRARRSDLRGLRRGPAIQSPRLPGARPPPKVTNPPPATATATPVCHSPFLSTRSLSNDPSRPHLAVSAGTSGTPPASRSGDGRRRTEPPGSCVSMDSRTSTEVGPSPASLAANSERARARARARERERERGDQRCCLSPCICDKEEDAYLLLLSFPCFFAH